MQGLTAHYLINDSFQLQPNQWCVIHAAAGGTGQLLVQMAKRAGAMVIAVCSTEAKACIATRLGADYVITTADKNEVRAHVALFGLKGARCPLYCGRCSRYC